MTVERFDMSDVLGPSPGYAYAAKSLGQGSTLYTAGAVPVDDQGELIAPGDLEGQTHAVIANLNSVLQQAGSSAEDVLKTTIYVAGRTQADLPQVWRVFAESPLSRAPSTLVGVTYLGYSGQLVEIEAIAAIGLR
jgi:enamine deaminase RidA (YjgF/YER057c/UK114 family)